MNSSVFVFSEEGKNVILRAVALVSKKTYFKPMLTFWPFYTIKHLYVPGPFVCYSSIKLRDEYTST